jgi:hypothetical protein
VSLTNDALERMKEFSTNPLPLKGVPGSRQKLFPGR